MSTQQVNGRCTAFHNVIVRGCGRVFHERYRPALRQLHKEGLVRRAVYLDLDPDPPFELAGWEHYLATDPHRLPMGDLRRLEALGPHTLAVVCTPTAAHLRCAETLLPVCGRVAVEKPLTRDTPRAQAMLEASALPYSIDHFLFKAEMRRRLNAWKLGGGPAFDDVSAIDIDLLETQGTQGRALDPALWDLGWHALALLLASFKALKLDARLDWQWCRTGAYADAEPYGAAARPGWHTAARLHGRLHGIGRSIPVDIRLGKGLDRDAKALTLQRARREPFVIDLGQGGWQAHGRVLRELLTPAEPCLGLSYVEALDVIQVLRRVEAIAQDLGTYDFGTLPAWFRDTVPFLV